MPVAAPALVKLHARVFRGSSGNYFVRVLADSSDHIVKLKGNLKKELIYSESGSRPKRVVDAKKRRVTDPVTVGDLVIFDQSSNLIESIFPRTTELARTSPGSHEQHVLVANLELLFVVVSAANPEPNLWMLDRFLVVAENGDIPAEIIVNKCDLLDDLAKLESMFELYRKVGYPVHFVSAKKNIGIDALKSRLQGKVAAFAGNSGVGKSSLLNSIQPGLTLKTGTVAEVTGKGRHTTTQAELVPILDGNTWLADTPGLTQLEFWGIDRDEIATGFLEIIALEGQCQFSNCVHRSEPGCIVRGAVESGEINERRYRSYSQMFDEAVQS